MIGSPAVAAWIAQLAFWVLLTLGIVVGELRRKPVTYGGGFVAPYLALLDIALVWLVFKQDIRLS